MRTASSIVFAAVALAASATALPNYQEDSQLDAILSRRELDLEDSLYARSADLEDYDLDFTDLLYARQDASDAFEQDFTDLLYARSYDYPSALDSRDVLDSDDEFAGIFARDALAEAEAEAEADPFIGALIRGAKAIGTSIKHAIDRKKAKKAAKHAAQQGGQHGQ